MARHKHEPDYKKYDKIMEIIKTAHNLIADCRDPLLELKTSKDVMDTFGFGLNCIRTGLNKLELEKVKKESEWLDFLSQFKIITYNGDEEELQEEEKSNV